jgi:DNA primase
MERKLVGVQNRYITKASNSLTCQLVNSSTPPLPRFRFPYGSRCSIYNLPVLKMLRPHEPLYITEGCSDCWAMLSAGNKAIAIPSATLLMAKDVEMISELVNRLSTPLHMFPDRDEPGERLFMQLKQLLPNLEHHQLPLGCKDFGEWWGKKPPPNLPLGGGT